MLNNVGGFEERARPLAIILSKFCAEHWSKVNLNGNLLAKSQSVQRTDVDEVQVLELGDGRHLEGGLLDRLCEVRDQVLEVNRLDGVHQQDG